MQTPIGFRDVVFTWFDKYFLMSRRPSPGPLEEGNPLLETGLAFVILSLVDKISIQDRLLFEQGMESCYNADTFFYNKKPTTRDETTHDDVIGIVAGSVAVGSSIHEDIYEKAQRCGWILSNTGLVYFESIVKPFDEVFYKMASKSGITSVSIYEKLILCMEIFLNMFTSFGSLSGKRLIWLKIKTLEGKSLIVDLVGKLWLWREKKRYGSIARIFALYYNNENHPFAKYLTE